MRSLRRRILGRLSSRTRQRLRRALRRPRWGNLRRTDPFSARYGFERGTPVDRVYIEAFLSRHAEAIRGDVLEVLDPTYAERFGGARVRAAHVVDVDPRNERATVIADLGEPGSLPPDAFDCFILTQTLQLIGDVETTLENAWRSLRPGGTLLISVPVSSMVEPSYPDLWRWTPEGLRRQLDRVLPDAETAVVGYGSLLTVVAFLYGLAAEELRPSEIGRVDPAYPLVACARVDRPR